MSLFKKTKRETKKEVSILIIYRNNLGELLTDERKIGFNDSLQIIPRFENKVEQINISSFEVIKDL